MVLTFILGLGENYKGQKEYDFIFSESEEEVIQGEAWTTQKAIDYGLTPPGIECIAAVARVCIDPDDIDIELVQEVDEFTIQDAVEGIVALGWEVDPPITQRTKRLVFRFGEDFKNIKDKFYSRDINIELNKISEVKFNNDDL